MRIILLIIVMVLTIRLGAQQPKEITIPLSNASGVVELDVDIKKGPIVVKGTPRKDVLVRYENMESTDLSIGEEKNGLRKISGGMAQLEITERENRVQVSSENWNKGVKIYIETPTKTNVKLQAYNQGDIEVENLTGELDLQSFNGHIKANNISGSISASTYNGPVVATFKEVTAGIPMAFSTYNGNVDLQFPPGFKGDLKIKTERGEVYTGFDINLSKSAPQVKQDSKGTTFKTYVDGWIRGKINGGGPEIMIKNYNGDIYIRKN